MALRAPRLRAAPRGRGRAAGARARPPGGRARTRRARGRSPRAARWHKQPGRRTPRTRPRSASCSRCCGTRPRPSPAPRACAAAFRHAESPPPRAQVPPPRAAPNHDQFREGTQARPARATALAASPRAWPGLSPGPRSRPRPARSSAWARRPRRPAAPGERAKTQARLDGGRWLARRAFARASPAGRRRGWPPTGPARALRAPRRPVAAPGMKPPRPAARPRSAGGSKGSSRSPPSAGARCLSMATAAPRVAGRGSPPICRWRSGGPRRARPRPGVPPVGAEVLREAPSGALPGQSPGITPSLHPRATSPPAGSPPSLPPSPGGCLSARGSLPGSLPPGGLPRPVCAGEAVCAWGVACSATIVPVASAQDPSRLNLGRQFVRTFTPSRARTLWFREP